MTTLHVGCRTSVDVVQHQQYSTRSAHGVKRTYETAHLNSSERSALAASTNSMVDQDAISTRRHRQSGKNRIEASKISNVVNHSDHPSFPSLQTRTVAQIPGPSQNPLLSLSHPRYGLPAMLVDNLASMGIYSIYPWQSSCLLGRGLLDGEKNLVYTAPTGGGKSLVADVLMLKKVIEDPSKKAIVVLPYVALVQEKLKWLRKVVEGVPKKADEPREADSQLPRWRKRHVSSIRVVGFFGGSRARISWSDVDIAVCTIEKVCGRFLPIEAPSSNFEGQCAREHSHSRLYDQRSRFCRFGRIAYDQR